LHESRSALKGEWSYSWARLSIEWLIEDLIVEYCFQIENHFFNVLNSIQTNHWRTNPQVLSGWKIAIFRKSTALNPSFMTGVAIDPIASTVHSRIRVAFDVAPGTSPSGGNGAGCGVTSSGSLTALNTSQLGNSSFSAPKTPTSHANLIPTSSQANFADDLGLQNVATTPTATLQVASSLRDVSQPFVGDIAEPFWVLNTKKEGSYWVDPDEVFLQDSKKIIRASDKRVFWEMVRSLIELPRLNQSCKVGFKSVKDLSNLIKRPEFKILWTTEASEHLPKEVNSDLVTHSFCIHQSNFTQ
jgi:hypothetical protein